MLKELVSPAGALPTCTAPRISIGSLKSIVTFGTVVSITCVSNCAPPAPTPSALKAATVVAAGTSRNGELAIATGGLAPFRMKAGSGQRALFTGRSLRVHLVPPWHDAQLPANSVRPWSTSACTRLVALFGARSDAI